MVENSNKTTGDLSDTEKMVQDALAEAQSSLDDMQQQTQDATGSDDDADQSFTAGAPGVGAAFGSAGSSGGRSGIELLSDVDLQVSIELGRTRMLVEDVLKLSPGSVVELDKLAGDPVDVYVNHRLVARGEVLVLNDNFCIRISEIVADLEEAAESNIEKNETF